MGFHGGGWWGYLSASSEKPRVTWGLLKRVIGYSSPYRWHIIGMLMLILISTGLTLLTPLILRQLIDVVLPAKDIQRLVLLAFALLLIPAIGGLINVWQRRLNAVVGEGVIYDLRVALYAHLQRMSLRFFTKHAHRRADEPPEQRCDWRPERHQQHHRRHHHQPDPGGGGAAGHALPGMAPDPDQHPDPAVLHPGRPPSGGAPAGYRPRSDGYQRPDERHDERDAQYQRDAAGQAFRALPGGGRPLRRARWRACAISASAGQCWAQLFS